MVALGFDFRVELEQPAFEHAGGIALGAFQNREYILQLQSGVAINADLFDSANIAIAIPAIAVGRAASRFEQPEGLVIEQSAAAQAAPLG